MMAIHENHICFINIYKKKGNSNLLKMLDVFESYRFFVAERTTLSFKEPLHHAFFTISNMPARNDQAFGLFITANATYAISNLIAFGYIRNWHAAKWAFLMILKCFLCTCLAVNFMSAI